jgi:hypothetical protein
MQIAAGRERNDAWMVSESLRKLHNRIYAAQMCQSAESGGISSWNRISLGSPPNWDLMIDGLIEFFDWITFTLVMTCDLKSPDPVSITIPLLPGYCPTEFRNTKSDYESVIDIQLSKGELSEVVRKLSLNRVRILTIAFAIWLEEFAINWRSRSRAYLLLWSGFSISIYVFNILLYSKNKFSLFSRIDQS